MVVIATTVMMILNYGSLAKDDKRESTAQYMKKVNKALMIDLGIKIAGTAAGLLFWPPLVSIGVLGAAGSYLITKRNVK